MVLSCAAAQLSFAMPVRLAAVGNIDDEDDQQLVFDVAHDSVVADLMAPQASHVTDKRLTHASRVFKL